MMSLSRRQLFGSALLAACAVAVNLPALAQGPRALQEGKDYTVLKQPQPVDSGKKIEVIEFFQYTCPHCMSYNPVLESWRKTLPADVDYRRVPITWDDSNLPHVKIYYALESLGKVEAMHARVFNAIQVDKKRLLKPDEIADFMAANGIDRKQWLDAYNSFGVATKANRAGQIWRAYKVDGTPMMAVDGRFLTAPSMVGSREGSVVVLDALIQRARTERK